MKNLIVKILKFLVPICIGAYLVWYMVSLILAQNQEEFWNTIQSMNYGWIFLSLAIGLMSHMIRAHRWKYLLEPLGYKTKFSNRYHATMVGYVVNMVLPRAGEASRAGVLVKTNDLSFSKTFGTILAERVVDVVMLGIIGLLTVALSFKDFETLYNSLLVDNPKKEPMSVYLFLSAFLISGIIIVFIIIKFKGIRDKLFNFFNDLKSGVFSIFQSKHFGSFVFYSLAIWVLYVTYFGVCFFALDEATGISLQGVLMAFIAGTIGVMLTPGGLGSYPIFVGTVISFYVYPESEGIQNNALALATVIWLSQTAFLILLGLVSLFYISRNFPTNHASNF